MWRDLRHGARLLLRAPGFSIVAVCALAVGIGANTAIFGVVYTLRLKLLPYKDPERLVVVWEHNIPRDKKNNVVSPGNFIHWREMQQSFDDLSAVGMTFKVTLTGIGEPEEVPTQVVSASFFPLLGVQPALGRVFTAEEDRPNSRVVVISDRIWKRRFDGDRNILSTSGAWCRSGPADSTADCGEPDPFRRGRGIGLVLAWWGIGLLRAVVAERLPIQRLETVAIDGPVA